MIHFRLRYERLRDGLARARRRRRWLRAAWVALLLPFAGLLAHVAFGLLLRPGLWLAAALICALLLGLLGDRRAARAGLERELDRRFGLDDLLVTAVEVDRRGPRGGMESRLLDDAASAVARLGRPRRLGRGSEQREWEMLAGLALMLAGLWLLAGTLAGPPHVERLPGLPSPEGQLAGPDAEGGDLDGAGMASAAGAHLASTLGDHAAAREIARALASGDPAAAARAARSLADRAGGLSEAGRQALGDALARAARELSGLDPELAEALEAARQALDSESAEARAAGIEGLAEAMDAMAREGPRATPPPMAAELRSRPPSDLLAPDAARLSLTASGQDSAPRARGRSIEDGEAGERRLEPTPTSGDIAAGGLQVGPLELGSDPLRVPWAQRDLVREYFDPRGRAP